jgi:DNA-binding MarR family transcriptional regulator
MASSDTQVILDYFRIIVKSLREASKSAEKSSGMSSAQLFVLQKIAESGEPLTINALAQKTHTHQSSVSVVVSKLVKAKLVDRVQSKVDARSAEVMLSEKAKSLLKKSSPLIQQRLIDGIARLSKEQRRGLSEGLSALIEKTNLQDQTPTLFFEETATRKKNV